MSDSILNLNGIELEMRWYGPPPSEKPTLIFLHEGLGCVAMWRDYPQKMAEMTGLGVLVYSRFGYGGSTQRPHPWPLTYLHEQGEDWLPQIISALKINEHILIGHSDGGSIALINAGGHAQPGLLGIITMAAHVFHEEITNSGILKTKALYEAGKIRPGLAKYHGEKVNDVFWGWCNSWLNEAWWSWNLEGYLPKIKVPALIMQGDEDPYGSPAQVEAIVKGIGAHAEAFFIPDCQHTPHREQPEITTEQIVQFIEKLTSKR